jgi:hypothetical protein
MFRIAEDRSTDQIRRRTGKVDPRSTAAKRALKVQPPAWNNSENPDEGQVKALDIILIEPLFQQLGTQDVKLGKRLDTLQVGNPEREVNVCEYLDSDTFELRLQVPGRIQTGLCDLFMEKSREKEELRMFESKAFLSFGDSAFANNQARFAP